MAIGALAYTISFLLSAVQRYGDSYWAFFFPSLCLCVVGADFQFNVSNVSFDQLTYLSVTLAHCVQMYVLSSMPTSRQSIAGSLFQTLTRLCTAVGYGVATAIFNAVESSPAKFGYYANNPAEPYAAVFWFSTGISFLGIFFLPFLKIKTQGHRGDEGRLAESEPHPEAEIAPNFQQSPIEKQGDQEAGVVEVDSKKVVKSA
jgi:hypothetical protein